MGGLVALKVSQHKAEVVAQASTEEAVAADASPSAAGTIICFIFAVAAGVVTTVFLANQFPKLNITVALVAGVLVFGTLTQLALRDDSPQAREAARTDRRARAREDLQFATGKMERALRENRTDDALRWSQKALEAQDRAKQ